MYILHIETYEKLEKITSPKDGLIRYKMSNIVRLRNVYLKLLKHEKIITDKTNQLKNNKTHIYFCNSYYAFVRNLKK